MDAFLFLQTKDEKKYLIKQDWENILKIDPWNFIIVHVTVL